MKTTVPEKPIRVIIEPTEDDAAREMDIMRWLIDRAEKRIRESAAPEKVAKGKY
jgi:hypothetical protein